MCGAVIQYGCRGNHPKRKGRGSPLLICAGNESEVSTISVLAFRRPRCGRWAVVVAVTVVMGPMLYVEVESIFDINEWVWWKEANRGSRWLVGAVP